MVMAVILVILVIVILAIWIFTDIKRMNHKFFTLLIIILIIFLVFSAAFVFRGKQTDYKTVPGLISATKVYFSWLGGIFGNMKVITANAIHMNWNGNGSGNSSVIVNDNQTK